MLPLINVILAVLVVVNSLLSWSDILMVAAVRFLKICLLPTTSFTYLVRRTYNNYGDVFCSCRSETVEQPSS